MAGYVTWDVTRSPDISWLIDLEVQSSGQETYTSTITFKILKNTTSQARQDSVSITLTDGTETSVKKLSVKQAAHPDYPVVTIRRVM